MKVQDLLLELIFKHREVNHEPVEIFLGEYMLDELKGEVGDMISIKCSGIGYEFMGIKIITSHEHKYAIGVA